MQDNMTYQAYPNLYRNSSNTFMCSIEFVHQWSVVSSVLLISGKQSSSSTHTRRNTDCSLNVSSRLSRIEHRFYYLSSFLSSPAIVNTKVFYFVKTEQTLISLACTTSSIHWANSISNSFFTWMLQTGKPVSLYSLH